ncbi:hypothetical protein ACDQ55_13290 [Chitinophaga sp. 30R24]|uniref:hypothetical protein n=1 Tax=Chitinophaga sp. 30R24 TaxID=3248838 RepID=UPI003B91D969
MKYMKNIIACIFLLLAVNCLQAQSSDNMVQAAALLAKAGQALKHNSLSFDLHYTFANEHQPNILLDSLNGSMQVSPGNERMELGSSLIVRNPRYTIIVFKDDKLIHLSKFRQMDTVSISPLEMMTTSIKQAGVQSCSIKQHGDTTIIRFAFPAAAYKYLEIKMDSKSFLVYEFEYLVKSSLLSEQNSPSGVVYEPYALVKASFDHYKKGIVDPTVFDENQFFTRKADTLLPAIGYEEYEVFVGTPNI